MFKNKPLETRKTLVKAMVIRMAQAYGVKKSALPELIDCQKNVINNWGYYGRIPYEYLDQCSDATGISMDWLLCGNVPQFELTDQKLAELRTTIAKLFADGDDYGMITSNYFGAIKQMENKFEKDLLIWLGCKTPDLNTIKYSKEC